MRRHEEVRRLPRAVGEEVKETAVVRDTGGEEKVSASCSDCRRVREEDVEEVIDCC